MPHVMEALRPLLIAALVVTEVAIWQWRMVIAHRGARVRAMLLGIVGAVLQITAITQVVADVHDPAGIVAYAVGVGFGVLLGLVAGERLTPGMISVTIITKAPDLARSLWDKGWPVTAQPGRAENGPVTILSVPVNRRDEARLHRDVRSIAPEADWTTKDLRAPNLVHQADKRRRLRARPGIDGPLRKRRCHPQAGVATTAARLGWPGSATTVRSEPKNPTWVQPRRQRSHAETDDLHSVGSPRRAPVSRAESALGIGG